jgi:hypothetical protein
VANGIASSSQEEALIAPTLSVAPVVGGTVTAQVSSRTPTAGFTYQWLLNGTAIRGATGSSYTPVPADAGKQLQVRITAPGQSVLSKPVTVRATEFRTTSRPGFRGTAAVGSTVTAITGRWSPSPTFEYQWLLEGRPIKGATHATLVVAPAHAGKSISLRITAKRTGYVPLEATSEAVVIRKGALKASTPRITGAQRVGDALHVAHGKWEPQPEFQYQWFVNGRPVEGRGTGVAYKVRPQDRGKRIAVEVTGFTAGYEPVSRKSASTPRVRGV